MYCLYKEKCSEEGISKSDIVKSWLYRYIFKTEFNLSFKVPSVDTCDQCDKFKIKIQDSSDENKKLQLTQDHNHHLKDAENRYSAKRNDKERREKTKWVEDFSIGTGIETLIICSDNCPSQNRNIMMIVNYFYLLQIKCPLKRVIHKFLLRGHTHTEVDHRHALIERFIKKQPTTKICTPWDWQQPIRSTGATVIEMQLSDFKNYEPLYSGSGSPLIHKKQTVDKEVFLISSAVWLEIRRKDPGDLYYKTEILQDGYKMWVPVQFHDFYKNVTVVAQQGDDDDDD
nr:unnamed protein product [Callosobruchus analis]